MHALDHGSEHKEEDPDRAARRVCLKFMRNKDQWQQELSMRGGNTAQTHTGQASGDSNLFTLDEGFVLGVLRAHNGSVEGRLREDLAKRKLQDYPFILCMPRADRSLADVLQHEHLAPSPEEVHWPKVRIIAGQVAEALHHLHSKGIMHGDVKPLNVMRMKGRYLLIDMDAAAQFGEPAGAKSSSAFIPPEMVHEFKEEKTRRACVKVPLLLAPFAVGSPRNAVMRLGSSGKQPSYTPEVASPSIDLWSLGALLFQLCTGRALFDAFADDTLDEQGLIELAGWSDAEAREKTGTIRNRFARHLVCSLLTKEPSERMSLEKVLAHPFVTDSQMLGRLPGEQPYYDAFISYRVATDLDSANELHDSLTRSGFRVFWDKLCLEDGRNWEEGFCDGLVQSRVFIALLSEAGLYGNGRSMRGNISKLTAASDCDNVILEQALALELKGRNLIERVAPVLIDARLSAQRAPMFSVNAIDERLAKHLQREGLGEPQSPGRSVKQIVAAILESEELKPSPAEATVEAARVGAGAALVDLLVGIGCRPAFEVLISFRGGCKDDQKVANELCRLLAALGTRATAAAASTTAAALLKCKPRVMVAVESATSLKPLKQATFESSADPVAVEWAVAVALQAAGQLEFVYPLLLGDPVEAGRQGLGPAQWHAARESDRRSAFQAWGGGSEIPVEADRAAVFSALRGRAANLKSRTTTSKQTIDAINTNQGQKVGGRPELALEAAAVKIRGMVQALEKGRKADDQLLDARAHLAALQQRGKAAQREKEKAQRREKEAQREKEEAQRREKEAQRREKEAQREKEEAQRREKEAQREKEEAQRREKEALHEKEEMLQRLQHFQKQVTNARGI